MSGSAQAVGGRLGVRCVAGSVVADGQVTARDQGVWLNRNDEFVLDGELASVSEESLGDNRGFIGSRDQKHMCVWPFARDNHPVFSQQASKNRAQGCRWTEVKLRSRRRGKREREKSFGPHHRQRERRIRSHAYSVAQLVQFVRERTCETIP